MSEVVVVAAITVAPGKSAEAEEALRDLIAATHGEAGCVRFALHRDVRDPSKLVLIERWLDHAALDAHLMEPHLATFRARIAGLVGAPTELYVMEPLPAGDPVKGALS